MTRARVVNLPVVQPPLDARTVQPFTPKHNGQVERYQRILAEELLYARPFTSEAARAQAIKVWNVHDNYHRPHTAAKNQPPAARLGFGVTYFLRSYS